MRKRSQYEKCSARGVCTLRFSPFPKILSFVIQKNNFFAKNDPLSIGGTPGSQNLKRFTTQKMFGMWGFSFEISTIFQNIYFCN